MAWLSGWSHRKTVTVTGQSGAGTNYQVDFSIGDTSGGDFHLENHCTSFPNDIEVTDNDQTTTLDHWVEDLTVDPITMWVEVTDDLGSNVDICVYYGKSGASSASNIGSTFLFGDDFPGSSLDTNKWDSAGDVSVSGGEVTIGGGTADSYIRTKTAFNYPLIAVAKSKITDDDAWLVELIDPTPYNHITIRRYDYKSNILFWHAAYTDSRTEQYGGSLDINYHVAKIVWIDGSNAKTYVDSSEVTFSADANVPDSNLRINIRAMGQVSSGTSTICEYAYVRKYNSTEPAYSSAGAEENAPTGFVPYPHFSGMDGGIGEAMTGGIAR